MRKKFLLGNLVVILIVIGGTLGYMLIDDFTFWDALYMTVITISTVGFSEIRPLSLGARVLTMCLIATGVATVLYMVSLITQIMVEGQLNEFLGRKSLERQIRAQKGHFIVCGHGRIGSLVSAMLEDQDVSTVVIEKDQGSVRRLEKEQRLYVYGSATEDETLLAAGIDRARGVIASVGSDADNLFIVLSAKSIRPDLFVVARADEPGSERKMKRAGADKVISPYFMGARRMAQSVLRPSVADFVDLTFHGGDMALLMEQVLVGAQAEMAGMALKDSGIRQKLDLIILSVKKADGRMIFNPQASTVIDVGDTLIALGTRESMNSLGLIMKGEH